MLGAWFQSFRSRRSLPRGTTQLSVILRKRNGWVRAKALFRASLASIWQNCVLEWVLELLLVSSELLLLFLKRAIDFQLFTPPIPKSQLQHRTVPTAYSLEQARLLLGGRHLLGHLNGDVHVDQM